MLFGRRVQHPPQHFVLVCSWRKFFRWCFHASSTSRYHFRDGRSGSSSSPRIRFLISRIVGRPCSCSKALGRVPSPPCSRCRKFIRVQSPARKSLADLATSRKQIAVGGKTGSFPSRDMIGCHPLRGSTMPIRRPISQSVEANMWPCASLFRSLDSRNRRSNMTFHSGNAGRSP